jgi:hypothetical protein
LALDGTKAGLRTSVNAWTKRDFTDAEIDDFIVLCEAEVNRVMRLPMQETRDAAFTINSEYTALPTGFREFRSLFITNSPSHPLKPISPQAATDYFDAATSGTPLDYMVTGSNIRVFPAPDGTYTADIIYYVGFDAITNTTTNWLFDNHPDVYLWGALMQTAPYIGDDPRVSIWQGKYTDAVKAVIDEGNRTRWRGGQPMQRIRVNP